MEKVKAAKALTHAFQNDTPIGKAFNLNDYPARPQRPIFVAPSEVPRRRLGTEAGRGALLHAVAHIEFNAIDLAADMLARFINSACLSDKQRQGFAKDWVSVCDDEARHFDMVCKRLRELGVRYGDHPAHNGLWDAAIATKDNFAARLAIAPLVLEARGLDVTPAMIEKLKAANDVKSADVLNTIYTEEVRHVAIGRYWFGIVAKNATEQEEETFKRLVKTYFKGSLKPPFNMEARDKAQLPREFYLNNTRPTWIFGHVACLNGKTPYKTLKKR